MVNLKEVGISKQIGKPTEEKPLSDQEKAESRSKRDKVKDEELGEKMLENIKDNLTSAKQIIKKDENPLAPKLKLLKGHGIAKNLIRLALEDINFILDKLNVSQKITAAAQNYKTELENLMAEIEQNSND